MSNVSNVLNKWGGKIVSEMQKTLMRDRKNNRGNLISSIHYKPFTGAGGSSYIQIYMKKYGQYVDSGRRPGKYVPYKPLEEWLTGNNGRRFLNSIKVKWKFKNRWYTIGKQHMNKKGKPTNVVRIVGLISNNIKLNGIKPAPFIHVYQDARPNIRKDVLIAATQDMKVQIKSITKTK
jgi:hypothetical protein